MAINHSQKLARILFKLLEDLTLTAAQRLEATSQLSDLLARSGHTMPKRKRYPKRVPAADNKPNLLG